MLAENLERHKNGSFDAGLRVPSASSVHGYLKRLLRRGCPRTRTPPNHLLPPLPRTSRKETNFANRQLGRSNCTITMFRSSTYKNTSRLELEICRGDATAENAKLACLTLGYGIRDKTFRQGIDNLGLSVNAPRR